jgi:hypothetical protein
LTSKAGLHHLGDKTITLGDNSSQNLLADRVEHFLLIVSAQQLMDFGQLLGNRLLEDTKRNADSLQVLSTSGHVNINWV